MVRWSALASSRRCARSSTGGIRFQFQARKPVAAAQNSPTIQRAFFMVLPPRCVLIPILCTTMRLTRWRLRNSDVLLVCVWRFRGCGGNGYTLGMDSVRFGRVLGIGARLAAKTMVSAVDAATAPNPSAAKAKQGKEGGAAAGSSSTTAEKAKASGTQLGQNVGRKTAQVRQTGGGVKGGGGRVGGAGRGAVG